MKTGDNFSVVEKRSRRVIKSLSWRTLGTVDTIFISWLVVGNVNFAVTIGGIELFTKMVLYFFHERAWNRSNFGRVENTPVKYEIE